MKNICKGKLPPYLCARALCSSHALPINSRKEILISGSQGSEKYLPVNLG